MTAKSPKVKTGVSQREKKRRRYVLPKKQEFLSETRSAERKKGRFLDKKEKTERRRVRAGNERRFMSQGEERPAIVVSWVKGIKETRNRPKLAKGKKLEPESGWGRKIWVFATGEEVAQPEQRLGGKGEELLAPMERC